MEEKFIMGNVATMSDPRESMKYKVGEEVSYAGIRGVVSSVRVVYSVDDMNGECIASQVGGYMLDPADKAAQ